MSDPNTEDYPRTNVFLSYCKEDRFHAGTMKLDLERRGAEVFFDMDKLRAGTWREQVGNEIGQADFFLVLLTPNAVSSDAVKAEIEVAHALLQPEQIIPVVLQTCDMPLSLNQHRYVDFVEAEYDYAIVDLARLLGLSTEETFKHDPAMPESWLRSLRRLERMLVVAFLVLVVWLSYSLGWRKQRRSPPGLRIPAPLF